MPKLIALFRAHLKSQAHSKAARAVLQHANAEPAVKFANPSALLLNFLAADIFTGRAVLNFSAKFNACRDSKALKTHNAQNFRVNFNDERHFYIPRRICARANFARRHDLYRAPYLQTVKASGAHFSAQRVCLGCSGAPVRETYLCTRPSHKAGASSSTYEFKISYGS